MSAETAADRARRLLEGTTPGPWWPSRHNGPNDVDRGKIWGFRAGPPPVQAIVVGEVNRFIGTAADQKIMAAAPDLARALIAETEAHEATKRALQHEIHRLLLRRGGRKQADEEIAAASVCLGCGARDAAVDEDCLCLLCGGSVIVASLGDVELVEEYRNDVETRANLQADEVERLRRERDEARAELAAAWEETGRPSGCNTLAGAVRWAFRGKYSRDEMSAILGRREGETTAEAARRVVAERDALQGRRCLACGGTGQGLGLHPCDACQGGAR